MRIVGAGGSNISTPAARRGSTEAYVPDAPKTESRALIAIEAPTRTEHAPRATRHPAAGFLAQLIATQMLAPQTRARRRAGPQEATAVYRSMTEPVVCRRVFSTRA